VQFTVVAPSGNVDPLAGVQPASTEPSTTSVAVAVNAKLAPPALVASTLAFVGTVRTGAVVSVTVTVNEAIPVLPLLSIAVQPTVFIPTGNVDPLAGVQFAATPPSTTSLALAA
jgi:hypothetical protein